VTQSAVRFTKGGRLDFPFGEITTSSIANLVDASGAESGNTPLIGEKFLRPALKNSVKEKVCTSRSLETGNLRQLKLLCLEKPPMTRLSNFLLPPQLDPSTALGLFLLVEMPLSILLVTFKRFCVIHFSVVTRQKEEIFCVLFSCGRLEGFKTWIANRCWR